MTYEEHRDRHLELHRGLEELVADYLTHNPNFSLKNISVFGLMAWSIQQAKDPEGKMPAVHVLTVCAHCGDIVLKPDAHQCPAPTPEVRA